MCLGASGIATGYPLDTVKVLIILSLPGRIVTPLVLPSGADANTSCLLNWREKVSVDLPDDQQACLLRKGGVGFAKKGGVGGRGVGFDKIVGRFDTVHFIAKK